MLHRIAALLIVALAVMTLIGVTPALAAETTAQDIARLKAQCDKGESRSCGILANNYKKGDGVKQDPAAALKLNLRACTLGDGFYCDSAGDAYMAGEGTSKDPARAISLWQRGCGLDDGYSCYSLSEAYKSGQGVAANPGLALELSERACLLGAGMCEMLEADSRDLLLGVNNPLPEIGAHIKFCEGGDMGWCALLGMRYQDNVGVDWSEQNERLALKYYTMACDAGEDEACQFLGPLLVRFGRDDYPSKPRDRQYDVLAVKALQKSCNMGWGTNCSFLGDMVRRGIGTTRNVALADQLRERGCVLWSMVCPKEMEAAAKARAAKAPAAAPAAPKQSAPPTQAKATESPAALQSACDRNDFEACVRLGLLYDGGKGVPTNLAKGYELFKKACERGNIRLGCTIMGNSLYEGRGVPKNVAAAIEPTAKSCRAGDNVSCYRLAYQFQEGIGVAKDVAASSRLYARGCELGNGGACAVMGARNFSGTYIAKNVPEAIRLYQRACDLNVFRACGMLSSIYFSGDGVAADDAKSHALGTKACTGDSGQGCLIAGFVLYNGVGGQPKNLAAAARLFEKSCTLKYAAGCKRLGRAYAAGDGVARDAAKSASFARTACELDKAQCETAATARQAAAPAAAPRAAPAAAITSRTPIAPGSILARGVKLYRERDMQPALAMLLAAAKQSPDDPRVYAYLASTYDSLGMSVESRMAADTAIRLDPKAMEILR